MTTPPRPRPWLFSLAIALLFGLARPATAQTYTWTSTTSGNWSDPTKWLTPPGVPVSGSGTVIEFTVAGGSPTATQDIATDFQANGLIFNAAGTTGPLVNIPTGSFTLVANG